MAEALSPESDRLTRSYCDCTVRVVPPLLQTRFQRCLKNSFSFRLKRDNVANFIFGGFNKLGLTRFTVSNEKFIWTPKNYILGESIHTIRTNVLLLVHSAKKMIVSRRTPRGDCVCVCPVRGDLRHGLKLSMFEENDNSKRNNVRKRVLRSINKHFRVESCVAF